MKLKRILMFLLAVLILFAFSACRSDEVAESVEQSSSQMSDADEESSFKECTVSPLFWKVTDSDGDIIWLLGSIHAGMSEYYPLPEYMVSAYNGADAIAVEADIVAIESDLTAMLKAAAAMNTYLMYRNNETLEQHISSDLYSRTIAVSKEYGVYSGAYERYQPAFWVSVMSNILCSAAGMDSELGIDRYFLGLAHESGKEIIEIESAEFQYKMLGGFSDELQLKLLEDSVAGIEDKSDIEEMKKLAAAWGRGNLDELTRLCAVPKSEDALNEEYRKAMYAERNVGMTEFCKDALDGDKEIFVIVGLAHMLGEDGIVKNLSELGLKVELVRN